jgi:hypothetical protein
MADSATRSVASEDGTMITSARYGEGPPIVLVGGAFQYRAFDPPAAGCRSSLADFEVFHVSRIASTIGSCTERQPPPPCSGRGGDWRQRCAQ